MREERSNTFEVASEVLRRGVQFVLQHHQPNPPHWQGTCKLLGLVVSDLVDEDFVRNRRSTSFSAFVFGTANFLAKPGQVCVVMVAHVCIHVLVRLCLYTSLCVDAPLTSLYVCLCLCVRLSDHHDNNRFLFACFFCTDARADCWLVGPLLCCPWTFVPERNEWSIRSKQREGRG